MTSAPHQGNLLAAVGLKPNLGSRPASAIPPLGYALLHDWQCRLANHQAPMFRDGTGNHRQGTLLPGIEDDPADHLRPLELRPLPLSFWSWPGNLHTGPAIYLVMDQPAAPCGPLLLYIGETGAAEQRWKGKHDCKDYLSAYREALHAAGLQPQLSIRFWMDVPVSSNARRQLEQTLIHRWLPAFNREVRRHWSTPFHH